MEFTKEQLSELICKHTEKENGLQDLMEIMLESLMVSERREYLQEEGLAGNKCNGYRPGRSYGHGRTLTFRIPRDRYGNGMAGAVIGELLSGGVHRLRAHQDPQEAER